MGIGELAALGAALFWAVSSMLWGRVKLSALEINLCKNLFGTVYLAVHLLVIWILTGGSLFHLSASSFGWLSLSGLIGIVLGDTLYFRSLQILGPRLSLMIASVSPLAAALLGWCWLSESLAWLSCMGIVITSAGVITVVAERKAKDERPGIHPGKTSTGILCGIGAAFTQAAGGVLSKMGMVDCGPVEATLVRIAVAALITTAMFLVAGRASAVMKKSLANGNLKLLVIATGIGTWMGIWFSQIGFKEASSIAVAQTMMATSPLFAIPLVYFWMKKSVSILAIMGTLIAIIGVALTVSQ